MLPHWLLQAIGVQEYQGEQNQDRAAGRYRLSFRSQPHLPRFEHGVG
jgi:hypothetical protein